MGANRAPGSAAPLDSSRDGVIGVRDPGGHNLPGVSLFRTNQAHLKKDGDEHPDSLTVVNSRLHRCTGLERSERASADNLRAPGLVSRQPEG